MALAGRASSSLPTGASKTAYYNMEAINALIHGLPHVSSTTASNQNAILTAKMGRACTYSELTKSLNNYADAIDADIRANGTDGFKSDLNKKYSGATRSNKKSFSSYSMSANAGTSSGSTPNTNNATNVPKNAYGNRNQQNSNTGRPKQNNVSHDKFKRTNKIPYSNAAAKHMRNKCSLCGMQNHKQTECRNMQDNSGKVKEIMPTQGTGNKCPQSVAPRLRHPEWICPYRPNGPLHGRN